MSTPTDRDGSTDEPVRDDTGGEQTDAEKEYTDLPAATREEQLDEEFPPEFGGGTKDLLGYSDPLDVAGNHP